jgi:hypothetical protein
LLSGSGDDESLEVFALAGGAINVTGVTIRRLTAGVIDPARLGCAGDDGALMLAVYAAVADLPAGEQRQQAADSGEVETGLAHKAEHGGNPGIVTLREIAGSLGGLEGNDKPLALVEAKQVNRDAKVAGNFANLDAL